MQFERIRIGLASIGVTGLAAALLGTGIGIAGLAGMGLRKPCAPALIYTAGMLVGGGLFAVGAVGAASGILNDWEWDATMQEAIAATISKRTKSKVPSGCVGCKYFSENIYLPCAVNPRLPEDCRDFQPKTTV